MAVKKLDDVDDCSVRFTATYSINKISLYSHYIEFFWTQWRYVLTRVAGIWLTVWAVAGLAAELVGSLSVNEPLYVFYAFALAFVISVVFAINRYTNTCPDGFDIESAEVRRIAYMKPVLWEWRLGAMLLHKEVVSKKDQLGLILNGKECVLIERNMSDSAEYQDWISGRVASCLRIVDSFRDLVMGDMPGALLTRSLSRFLPVTMQATKLSCKSSPIASPGPPGEVSASSQTEGVFLFSPSTAPNTKKDPLRRVPRLAVFGAVGSSPLITPSTPPSKSSPSSSPAPDN